MAKNPNELKPETLVNRVISGTKDYRTKDYLEAFAKLPSTELHSSNYSRFEILKLWNSLQSTPNKVRYFTFALHRDNSIVIKKIKEIYAHDKYAYICHDKDTSADRKHYHYVLMFDSPRSFKGIANDLEIPVTILQKVYSKKGILDYLTHENDPNKHHYELSEITANFDVEEEKNKGGGFDPWQEFCDYVDMVEGRMSPRDWFLKYHGVLCDIGSFSQRHQLYHRIHEDSCKFEGFGTGASLSSRSEFGVRTPVKNPFQTAFSKVFSDAAPWLMDGSEVVFSDPDAKKPPKSGKNGRYAKPNPRSDLNDIE